MTDNFNGERPSNETVNVHSGGPSGPVAQNNTLGVVGLVTGILALIFAVCCSPIGVFFGIVALICGIIAKAKGQKFAMAGIILGLVSIGLALIVVPMLGRAGLAFLEGFDFESWFEQFIE